ncbi:MAG: sigma-70 family RNA polymerase sigma factor [Anaerolineae bacterium]|nr:sigma-70 family RNA polymerase sigma factor [Anaerolineae bacterium]MDW8099486.1 sigma-70 family RNA polymerase sigma factor [Anaerolineae bacterium]
MSQYESESGLVERAKADPEAFGELYERYVDRIYNYIFYRVGDHHDAEDLTARTFFRALEHIDQYEDRGVPFSAWLYRIAHNLVANWHRDRNRRRLVSLDGLIRVAEPGGAPEHEIERREAQELLRAAIRRLPADRQQLLILKFGERLSNAEIGRIMGKTEGAIKSLYHRTLLALRDDLRSRGF